MHIYEGLPENCQSMMYGQTQVYITDSCSRALTNACLALIICLKFGSKSFIVLDPAAVGTHTVEGICLTAHATHAGGMSKASSVEASLL